VGGGERGVFWFGKDPDTTTHARLSEEEYFKLLNGARALLLPLKFASANNALLEAHSVGLPSVCTDLPGVHDYSVGTTSFFMDAAGAISRLEKLAALDDASTKALRAQTLEEGRRFDWRNVAGDIARIYKELVRSSP
jgi:glycosyltransferase involved in cell wall biosynthesis